MSFSKKDKIFEPIKFEDNYRAGQAEGKDIFLCFNKDQNTFAVKNELTLFRMLRYPYHFFVL